MQKVKVLRGQTLYDIAVQWLGDAQAATAIANTNGLSITAELEAGTELVLPAGSAYYEPAAAHFLESAQKPASAESGDSAYLLGGIGYMGIEINFIVS